MNRVLAFAVLVLAPYAIGATAYAIMQHRPNYGCVDTAAGTTVCMLPPVALPEIGDGTDPAARIEIQSGDGVICRLPAHPTARERKWMHRLCDRHNFLSTPLGELD